MNLLSQRMLIASLMLAIVMGKTSILPLVQTHPPQTTEDPRPMLVKTPQGVALALEIKQLFDEDQKLISETDKVTQEPALRATYMSYVERARSEGNTNFYFPQVYAMWAERRDAPDAVRQYVAFRRSTNHRIEQIVADNGWPQRSIVGDEAAADFWFLFGHADDNNVWRLTQLAEIERVFHEDHVNPQMYAHTVDRLQCVAKQPQIYGSIMGPGPHQDASSSQLYWPLRDGVATTNARRQEIGLPSIETELQKFREGAQIGPYMLPMTKDTHWTMASVFDRSQE
jgi:hypothetical protein